MQAKKKSLSKVSARMAGSFSLEVQSACCVCFPEEELELNLDFPITQVGENYNTAG